MKVKCFLAVLVMALSIILLASCGDSPTQPKPKTGILAITSIPSGANYSIDSLNITGKTPDTLDNLAPGTYIVDFSLIGYYPKSDTAIVFAGELTNAYGWLKNGWGDICIDSDPPGAKIFFNEILMNLPTPCCLYVQSGEQNLRLTKPGYKDWIGKVIVPLDDSTTISISLVPSP